MHAAAESNAWIFEPELFGGPDAGGASSGLRRQRGVSPVADEGGSGALRGVLVPFADGAQETRS